MTLVPPTALPTDVTPFRVLVTSTATVTTVAVCGEVDSVTAPAVRVALDDAVSAGTAELVVDLRDVDFLDSAGLCALAAGHQRTAQAGVRLRVQCRTRAVVRVLQLTGLWDVLGAELVAD